MGQGIRSRRLFLPLLSGNLMDVMNLPGKDAITRFKVHPLRANKRVLNGEIFK